MDDPVTLKMARNRRKTRVEIAMELRRLAALVERDKLAKPPHAFALVLFSESDAELLHIAATRTDLRQAVSLIQQKLLDHEFKTFAPENRGESRGPWTNPS